jgi:hypothetical protein
MVFQLFFDDLLGAIENAFFSAFLPALPILSVDYGCRYV